MQRKFLLFLSVFVVVRESKPMAACGIGRLYR